MLRSKLLLSGLISLPAVLFSQGSFYAPDTVQTIEITFNQPDWDYQMDTAKYGSGNYILAVQVKLNGTTFDSCGVKYKGYSSFDSTRVKNPLHIKLDWVKNNANYQGFEDIKLSNGFSDPSAVREVLGYEILRNYMDAPRSNFAKVFINGQYYGLMASSEDIDKGFLGRHFYSSGNTYIKCNPASVVSGQIPNLLYLGNDSTQYYSRYEMKSAHGWKDLLDLCDTLANKTSHVDSVLDPDRALWMLAFNNVTVNLDSYTGAFAQNYYLYRDDNRRFVPVIWDLNMCFGGFSATGTSNLTISGMQNMSPLLHSTYGARPLIMNLLAIPQYQRMYLAHMRTITAEFFTSGSYLTRAQALQTLIDTCVQADSNSLYSHAVFLTGLNTNQGNIPGLSNLMGNRAAYLASTPQFQLAPPAIATPSVSPAIVNLNDTCWITSKISLPSAAWLGYRFQPQDRFRRIPMYDDGLHHDGIAGDSIYGIGIVARSNELQYYIYAENSNAGAFSPPRAEYEYHKIQVQLNLPSAGDIMINEFMSYNVTDTTDETGQHEDWIEFYNTTSSPVNLYGLYLSDDPLNIKKFAFPNPSIVPPGGFLSVWCDEDPGTSQYIHTNFNLSSFGESILLSTGSGQILDSITFGPQSPDSSYGRCPNGTGAFSVLTIPTFNHSNCGTGIAENDTPVLVNTYPNPGDGVFWIDLADPDRIEVYSPLGSKLSPAALRANGKTQLDLTGFPPGAYLVRAQKANRTFRSVVVIR